jgi:hypothetical protein
VLRAVRHSVVLLRAAHILCCSATHVALLLLLLLLNHVRPSPPSPTSQRASAS